MKCQMMACFPGLDWCHPSLSPREVGIARRSALAQQGGLAPLWGFEVCGCASCPDILAGSFCESSEMESLKNNQ